MFVLKGYDLINAKLENNYDFINELGIYPEYSWECESSTDVIPNVRVCIYKCPKECTLEEAQNAIIDKYYGEMSVDSYEYGYSEYTIEGFCINKCMIGNHNLNDLLYDKQHRYTILTIERLKNNC